MNRVGFIGWMLVAGAAGFVSTAMPADAPKTIVPVFRVEFEPEDKFRALIFTDYFTGTAGTELLGLANNCTRSAPSGGMVTTTARTRIMLRPATGGPNVFNTLSTVTSLPYPDPNDPDNQCDGTNATQYDEGDYPNTQQRGCPRDPEDPEYFGQSFDPNNFDGDACSTEVAGGHFNLGMATGGGSTKYIIFSDAVTGTYRNASTGGNDVDASNFQIHVFNTAGTRIWTKAFPGLNSDGRLEPVLCGVGDFLGDDGEDELRVARIADIVDGQAFRYYYYDLDTGAKVGATVSVNVPTP